MKMKTGLVVKSYRELIQSFSQDELEIIVQAKRLFECIQGDLDLRNRLNEGSLSEDDFKYFRSIGINIDLEDISLLWEQPDYFLDIASFFGKSCNLSQSTNLSLSLLEEYPVLKLWFEYLERYNHNYKKYLSEIQRLPKNLIFDAWRMRRIKAVKSELGHYGYQLDNPVFAFELGKGCSVGCWFCAYAAAKLEKNFDYEENKYLFTEIVKQSIRLFGKDGAGYALLYSATEPHDNPHYLDFVRDFESLTGSTVCTSTAVTGDHEWIKSLIEYYRNDLQPWPRLSVLSKSALNKLHESFTPMELRDVRLVMQMRDSNREKVSAGRLFTEKKDRMIPDKNTLIPQGSISCISGFIVNLVDCSIKLVSPCYTSAKWPKGHRVYDKISFGKTADDFGRAITELMKRNMYESLPRDKTLAFRDDLVFIPTEEGFDLASPNQVHHFTGDQSLRLIGEKIAEKRYDSADLFFIDPVGALPLVTTLYNEGMLDEVFNDVED
jgi:radical SAM family RiPP maturation amino acid epimerase